MAVVKLLLQRVFKLRTLLLRLNHQLRISPLALVQLIQLLMLLLQDYHLAISGNKVLMVQQVGPMYRRPAMQPHILLKAMLQVHFIIDV